MRKILIISAIVLVTLIAIVLISAGVFFVKWNQCKNTKSTPEVVETVFKAQKAGLGEKIPCTFTVKTSWSLMPVSARVNAVEGLQEVKQAEIVPEKWMWGTRTWNVTVWLQPYRDGKYPEIPVEILCEGGPDGKAVANAKIPALQVELNAENLDGELSIAEEFSSEKEQKKKRIWIWYLCGAVILILGVIVWLTYRWKKRKKAAEIPVWTTALDNIAELRRTLSEQKITPETAVTKLTYIIRLYLEKRFSLRAERQTTSEFLESLRRDTSPLNVEQRRFLREFLSAADMVKFARLATDEETFEESARHAESLIRETSLSLEPKEKKS